MNFTNILINQEVIQQVCSDNGTMVGVWQAVSAVITVIQIVVPILLILMGSIDMVKAVMAGKDDEIKKAQGTLIKRVIAAIIVFFIPLLVQLMLGLIPVGDSNAGVTFKDCITRATE